MKVVAETGSETNIFFFKVVTDVFSIVKKRKFAELYEILHI
jgi:hypothetical protein